MTGLFQHEELGLLCSVNVAQKNINLSVDLRRNMCDIVSAAVLEIDTISSPLAKLQSILGMILNTLLPGMTSPEVKGGCICVTRVLPSTTEKEKEKEEKGEKISKSDSEQEQQRL
jgi:hypothetical protein